MNELALFSGVGSHYFSYGYEGGLEERRTSHTTALVQTISLDEYFKDFIHPNVAVILTLDRLVSCLLAGF